MQIVEPPNQYYIHRLSFAYRTYKAPDRNKLGLDFLNFVRSLHRETVLSKADNMNSVEPDIGNYYDSLVLFCFGDLEAAYGVIENFSLLYPNVAIHIGYALKALLPVPKGFDLEKNPIQFRTWLDDNKERLVWREDLGRYVEADRTDCKLIGWPDILTRGDADPEPPPEIKPQLNAPQRFGRVVIDNTGLEQKPILGRLGKPFKVNWSKITAWSITEVVQRQQTTGDTQTSHGPYD